MALIQCPECGKEVSDKAKVCINCGYPLEDLKPKQHYLFFKASYFESWSKISIIDEDSGKEITNLRPGETTKVPFSNSMNIYAKCTLWGRTSSVHVDNEKSYKFNIALSMGFMFNKMTMNEVDVIDSI